jgi:ABC-type amino acid transport substrate-binding protein
MIKSKRLKTWFLIAVLSICGTASFASCASNDGNATEQSEITAIADKVWAFSQTHPDGFTINIRTMTEPTEGIAVSYAATQNSYSCVPSVASELSSSVRDQLDKVVSHALQHEGYVGGWYNGEDGLYYFDSTKLFPENDLKGAIQFGKENGQYSVFILSTYTEIPINGKVAEILDRGTILFGTTGDYRPLSFCEPDGTYWGFGIEVAKEIAKRIGVGVEFKKTSWPTLTADVLTEPQIFDLAIGGITITDARRETMLMSDGYLDNGKTILCRASEADRYKSLADIDKPEVTVMVNPGGLNEKFANENLTHANIVVYQKNEEIPTLVAEGAADVMITEITEAPYYVQTDPRLAAPLLNAPFTHGEIGVLMQKGQEDLLQMVNNVICQMKSDGSLRKLQEKYGLTFQKASGRSSCHCPYPTD